MSQDSLPRPLGTFSRFRTGALSAVKAAAPIIHRWAAAWLPGALAPRAAPFNGMGKPHGSLPAVLKGSNCHF
jgi:hypothetical protein